MFGKHLTLVATLAIYASTIGAETVTFSCNSGGLVGNCGAFITDFCTQMGLTTFSPTESGNRCYNLDVSAGSKCALTAFFSGPISSAPGGFNVVNCENTLRNITENCPSGGSGNAGGGFSWSIDPNDGLCGVFTTA
ncbi:hypothetical protein K438DRAFT_1970309 [Mycena galopus ATCC 62051]|nr:hypothetical protein K438DRAFT_1970309 [Mycena galopus ATCC 62051]